MITKLKPLSAAVAALSAAGPALAAPPADYDLTLQARANSTGSSTFNLPPGTTVSSATPDINNAGVAGVRVSDPNFDGGIFVGGGGTGSAVYTDTSGSLLSDPTINNDGLVVFGGPGGIRFFDSVAGTGVYTTGPAGASSFTSRASTTTAC